MTIFGKALEIDPNNAGLWYKRACARVKKGKIEKSLADLKKAIEIDKITLNQPKKTKNLKV
jgi:tetratricopeptide (TPR) repeat protein